MSKIDLEKQDLSEEALKHYLQQDCLAIDCEMMGLNIYRDRLCLVQISDRDRNINLVQIAQGQRLAPNLKILMESPDVKKIFHFARTDLTWLKFYLDIHVENFFCTKIASKLARTYSDKHSLKEITKEITGKDLSKAQQSSDWGATTLTKEQKIYAASDVENLIYLYETLSAMLIREDRLEHAEHCIKFVSTLVDLDILGYSNILEH